MAEAQKTSNIPQHLRPFRRPSLTTEHLVTEAPYSYTPSKPAIAELCPPHWRRSSKRGIRRKLKSIILKDLQSVGSPERTPHTRPTIMRMKDSDDYITARAANPRTGLISPSVGTPTPRVPLTPESPAEALKRRSYEEPPSPTPNVKARPALRRAFERKGHMEDGVKLCREHNGWSSNASIASPKVTIADAGFGPGGSESQPHLNGDAFMVHMPSAREPQPYNYPGYSPQQIAAYEHYKQKTRRVSAEGYDKRTFHPDHHVHGYQTAGGLSLPGSSSYDAVMENATPPQWLIDRPLDAIKAVRTRNTKPTPVPTNNEMHCFGGAELHATSFAPFSSPRTPVSHSGREADAALKTIPRPAHQDEVAATRVVRKPIPRPSENNTTSSPPNSEPDLRHLPAVRLVPPLLASTPHNQATNRTTNHRQCSLGCAKDTDTSLCVQSRLATSHNTTTSAPPTLFSAVTQPRLGKGTQKASQDEDDGAHTSAPGQTSLIADILIACIISMLDLCKRLRFPTLRLSALDTLSAEDATPEQKAHALKTILSTAGQVLLVVTITAMLWQVGSAVIRCLQLLFWPVLLPLKVVRWICIGG